MTLGNLIPLLHCGAKVTGLRLVRYGMLSLLLQQGRAEMSLHTVSFLVLHCTGRDHVDWFVPLSRAQICLPFLCQVVEKSCHLGHQAGSCHCPLSFGGLMRGKNMITSPSMHINTPGTSHGFCKPWRPFYPSSLVPHALFFRVSPCA